MQARNLPRSLWFASALAVLAAGALLQAQQAPAQSDQVEGPVNSLVDLGRVEQIVLESEADLFLDAQGGFEEYPLDDGTQSLNLQPTSTTWMSSPSFSE